MPLEQSLNVSPYYDDYDQLKEFYRVLFKPGVAVQTRELNQLQAILQNQVEKFGDNIFKSGTILSGCNFHYMPNYSYIKILDTQQNDGEPSNPSGYVNYFVKSNLNLTARIVNYADGLESQSPDLKTLYLQYINSSDPDLANSSAVYTKFAVDQTLTVFSKNYPIFKYTVVNGGLGFANTDTVVTTPAITITGNTGAFTNGELLTQATTGAKVEIVGINTTAIANTIILSVKPRTVDLTNTSVNSAAWTLSVNYNVTGNVSGAVGKVATKMGTSAKGLITTDTLGVIQAITISSAGQDYSYVPHVTVKTSNTTATVNNLDLRAQNYVATIKVGNSSINSIGTGYAFKVTEGLIYQKGHFLRVDTQTLIVDKYSVSPNNVSVGFKTLEQYVDANEDSTLFDNANDTTNYQAPGADRLKLVPVLFKTTISEAASNTHFFPLAEWLDGYAYKENRTTAYTAFIKQLEQRTYETSGNFVINRSNVGARETNSNTTHYEVVVDPGLAYIRGKRFETISNRFLTAQRANTTNTEANKTISVNFGSYIKVNNLVGYFKFKTGDIVKLYDTAKNYIGNSLINGSQTITPSGNEIGRARIRSLMYDNGVQGTAACVYRLYVFDIIMKDGFSISDVRSVYNDNTVDGICDTFLEYDITTTTNRTKIYDQLQGRMLFPFQQKATKVVSDISYKYRTTTENTLANTTGLAQISVTGTGVTFPYTGNTTISSTAKKDFIVVPLANTQASSNVPGTSFDLNQSNSTVTGVGTTFGSSVLVGDFLKFENATSTIAISQVVKVTNSSVATVQTAPTFTSTITTTFNADLGVTGYGYFNANTAAIANATFNALSGVANGTEIVTTLAPHTFQDNDIVKYIVAAGNTSLAALKNNATYYVVGSNTTTLKLAATLGGAPIDLTSGANQTGHSLYLYSTDKILTTTSHNLVTGDIVTYNVSTGNTAVSGLSNGSNYYVGVVNTTAVKLYGLVNGASSGTPLFVTAGAAETGHLLNRKSSQFIVTTSPHGLSDNNVVKYTVSAGNTALQGLVNNQFYYITGSNTTAFKLSTTPSGGSNVTFTTSANQTGHTLSLATISATKATLFFPALYPIPLDDRSNRSIYISANSTVATINVGTVLAQTVNVYTTYNLQQANATAVAKNVNRNQFVKIHTSNNIGSNTGPWSLGVPGVFRLKYVYLGSNSTYVDTSGVDITKYFFVDHGQDEDSYRLSKLVKNPKLSYNLSNNVPLLVQFDAFTTGGTEGFFTVGSYPINDVANLASSNTTINTLEIPEMLTDSDVYYDLRDTVDFRPYPTNTAILTANATLATLNPADSYSLSGDDQLFPVPDSEFIYDIEYYLPRVDVVTMNENGDISVKTGKPDLNPKAPKVIDFSEIKLGALNIPALPTLPPAYANKTLQFASKQVGNSRGVIDRRLQIFGITPFADKENSGIPRRYAMADIGHLERRIEQIEYQSALNQVEQGVRDKVIPSGITPSSNRYKNGFFVELFDGNTTSAVNDHAEFAGLFDYERGLFKPKTKQLNVLAQFDLSDTTTNNLAGLSPSSKQIMLPYTEYTLVDQTIKTSLINSDGDKVIFSGDGNVDPPTFRIKTRLSVVTYDTGYGLGVTGTGRTGGWYGGWVQSPSHSCFLTSATVEALGLEDNCAELELARYLRDERMMSNKDQLSKDLYKIVGPLIVQRNSNWKEFYESTILPVSHLIETNQFIEAHYVYKKATIKLIDQYASRYSDRETIVSIFGRLMDNVRPQFVGSLATKAPYAFKYMYVKGGLKILRAINVIRDKVKGVYNVFSIKL